MVKRQIVQIDEEKCDGCGECVPSCEEGAIRIVNGKARLVSDVYCDGLGACLGHCPQGAILIIEREAEAFDEQAVQTHLAGQRQFLPVLSAPAAGGGCPGAAVQQLRPKTNPGRATDDHRVEEDGVHLHGTEPSGLANWPVQLHLVPPQAPFLRQAEILLVADCVPFACADFHRRFLDGRPVIVGCPKLDDGHAYVQKLAQILLSAEIPCITVLLMEVPCCTGLVQIAQAAKQLAGTDTRIREITISLQGQVLSPPIPPGRKSESHSPQTACGDR